MASAMAREYRRALRPAASTMREEAA